MLPNSIFSVLANAKAIFEMLKMTDKYAFLREKTCTIKKNAVPLRKFSDKPMRTFSMRTFSHGAIIVR
jgi:hypothetical protein